MITRAVPLVLLLACQHTPPAPAEPATPTVAPLGPGEAEAAVKDTIARYSGQVQYCYEHELQAHPSLQGRVEIGWTVERGVVGSSRVLSNDTGDDELAACLTRRLASWRFPEGLSDETSWPFVFRPPAR